MSNSDSRTGSEQGSPYGSATDLMDEDLYVERSSRKGRNKKAAGGFVDLDEVEQQIQKAQSETGEFVTDVSNIRSRSQLHSKKIHDLQLQFEEARIRIDKLLQRKSRSRSDFDSSARNVELDASESTTSHKVEITVNPSRVQKPTFEAVSLTVKLDED